MQSVKQLVVGVEGVRSSRFRICGKTRKTIHYIEIKDQSENLDIVSRVIDLVSAARDDLTYKSTRMSLEHGLTQIATVIFESKEIEQLRLPL